MKEKVDLELDRLDFYQAFSVEALNEFANNHPIQLTEFEKEKIIRVLNGMFSAEKDYLSRNPQDYFELYRE